MGAAAPPAQDPLLWNLRTPRTDSEGVDQGEDPARAGVEPGMKVVLILLGLLGSAWWMVGSERGSRAWDPDQARISYYADGRPRAEVSYRDGLPHGPAVEWYPDGATAARGRYEEGERVGPWTFWREDGSVDPERSGLYLAGRRLEPAQESADS